VIATNNLGNYLWLLLGEIRLGDRFFDFRTNNYLANYFWLMLGKFRWCDRFARLRYYSLVLFYKSTPGMIEVEFILDDYTLVSSTLEIVVREIT
jgi:hypothetical protein